MSEEKKYYKGKLVKNIHYNAEKKINIDIGFIKCFSWSDVDNNFQKYVFTLNENCDLSNEIKYGISIFINNAILSNATKNRNEKLLFHKQILRITKNGDNLSKDLVNRLNGKYLGGTNSVPANIEPIKCIVEVPNSGKKFVEDFEIIYEIVKDKNNNRYAREIRTGKIFPICNYRISSIISDWFISFKSIDTSFKWGQNCYFPAYLFATINSESFNYSPNTNLINASSYISISNPEFYLATEEEVAQYLNKKYTVQIPKTIYEEKTRTEKKLLFFKKNVKYRERKTVYDEYDIQFDDKIIEESQKNTFVDQSIIYGLEKNHIKPKLKETIIIEKDTQTMLLEEIEMLLLKLGNLDKTKAKEYKETFNKTLESENESLTLSPLTITSLNALKTQIEAEIESYNNLRKFNGDEVKKVNTIEKNIEDELNDALKLENIDLEFIDNLYLKVYKSSSYSTTIQKRNAILKIAKLYIKAIHDNKYTVNDLINSYLKYHLKDILFEISIMENDGEITLSNPISYENEISLEFILDCISKIKYVDNQNEEQNAKVKSYRNTINVK